MRRMEKITGRSDDMIILRGVNVYPTQIEEQLMATDGLSPHYQLELFRSNRMDGMRVHVEALDSNVEESKKQKLAQTLSKRIKDFVGISSEVVITEPGGVARSEGKAKRVVDNRPEQ